MNNLLLYTQISNIAHTFHHYLCKNTYCCPIKRYFWQTLYTDFTLSGICKNYAYFQLLEFGFCIFVAFIFIRMVLECSDFVFCSNLLYLNKKYLARIFIIYVYITNVNKSMALRPTYDSKTYQWQGVYDLKKSYTQLIHKYIGYPKSAGTP